MPKGFRKSAGVEIIVEPGSTHFPSPDGLAPEPLPAGVAVRSKSGVQIEFSFEGKRCTETLKGKPTVLAVRKAAEFRSSIIEMIDRGAFSYEQTFPNSRRARHEQAEAAQAQAHGDTTVGQLFDDFLERFRKNNPGGDNTYATHVGVIRSHLRAAFGHLRPLEVTPDLVLTFREGLRAGGMSDSRLSNVLTPLRGAMALAVERDLVDRNPFDKVSPTKPKKQKVVLLGEDGLPRFDEPLPLHTDRDYEKAARIADPFNASEREAILRALAGQVRAIFCFAFWTGLRTGELIALRWCDIDWGNKRVCVRIALSKRVFTPTKGRRMRWVPLLPPALAALECQLAHTGEAGRWVFNNPVTHDRWSSSERLRRRWARALKAAGVRYRYQYQTRHTYASARMSAGESASDVAAAMGHLDVRLVSIVYARFIPAENQEPGARTIAAYREEWSRLAPLLADNTDVVTDEDLAEAIEPDVESEEGDELDALER